MVMHQAIFFLAQRRGLWLITMIGLMTFAVVFSTLDFVAGGWATTVAPAISERGLSVILAALAAQFVMSLAGAALTRRLYRENRQMRTAMDSMAQGLCMFDAAERLVVCNTQYYAMYNLTPGDVRPGATLAEVLAKRVEKGTFARDPDQYRKEFLAKVSAGETTVHEVKSTGGWLLLVMNHPMLDGGWIGAHEDITTRRQAEHERSPLQQREELRTVIDDAI